MSTSSPSGGSDPGRTAGLVVVSSMATRQILAALAETFERRAGQTVVLRPMGGVDAARLIRSGEPADIVVLAAAVMEQLETEGHLVPGSRADFARSRIALAVPAGAPRPDLANADAVRTAILKAGQVGYSTGPSGDHLLALVERWGIAAEMAGRLVQAPPGVSVGTLVAANRVDLGLQQLSELHGLPGLDVVGPLPPDIQAVTVFTAAIAATSAATDRAAALITDLRAPETAGLIRQHGMEPA